jgi:hypothetical protein
MSKALPRDWGASRLSGERRVWFVTKWPGKYAGTPDAKMLFVFEIPRSQCLYIQLVADSTHGWEHHVLSTLASENSSPDVLITDHSQLQHALVSAGASFRRPATAYLNKMITLMPAIHQCLLSLTEHLNEPELQAPTSINKRNEAFELWRIEYNRRGGVGTT